MDARSADRAIAQGLQHHQAGRLAQAETAYRQVLAKHPRNAKVLQLLGVAVGQQGRWDEGLKLINRAVMVEPHVWEYHTSAAEIHLQLGRLNDAIDSFTQALRLNPRDPWRHYQLAMALRAAGRIEEAIAELIRAIEGNPKLIEAYRALSETFGARGDWKNVVAICEKAISIKPDETELYSREGIALLRLGRNEEAIVVYKRAAGAVAALAPPHYNMGYCYQTQGKFDEAITAYRRAIELEPDYGMAHNNLGNLLWEAGEVEEALVCHARAAATAHPELPIVQSNRLHAMHFRAQHDPQQMFDEHLQWNTRHAAPLRQTPANPPNDRDPARRLRIGYVSPDFRQHSVAYFLIGLLRSHDPQQVEVYAYSDAAHPDAVTAQLRQFVPHWRDTAGQSHEQLDALIRADQIDILVDLAGHTSKNRLPVFARKPAPVQVSYLGYPDTTGLEAMDYRFTDAIADPPGNSERFHTERLIRLDPCFLCYSPMEEPGNESVVSDLPAEKNGYISFGSFNAVPKINESLVQLWASILGRVDRSRLVLKFKGLGSEIGRRRLLQQFDDSGIGPERLDLRLATESRRDHLQTYEHVDLALDTFPYNGTTTTCEALWMGVPVITLRGESHMNRVGTTILTALGLTELVTASLKDYVERAVELANDISRLAILRSGLRQRMNESPLMACAGFAQRVEAAYREMWRTYCQSRTR